MTILIAGASGFIGNALAESFATEFDVLLVDIREPKNKHGHRFIQCDFTDWESVKCLPNADIIYHMCAYNNTAHFYTKPFSVAENSLVPTINLLKRYQTVAKFIYSSSSEIYAGAINRGICTVPTPEVDIAVIDQITNPRWSYAGAKTMGEILVHAAHVQHGLPYVIMRYHNVYGAAQLGHFIPEYADRIRSGHDELMGPDQTRAFLYIKDAVTLTRLIANNVVNDTINIGSNTESSIADVAALIRRLLNVTREPILVSAPSGSVARRLADITKLLEHVGDFQFTNLDEGLRLTLSLP